MAVDRFVAEVEVGELDVTESVDLEAVLNSALRILLDEVALGLAVASLFLEADSCGIDDEACILALFTASALVSL